METTERIMDTKLEIEHNTGASCKKYSISAHKAVVFREWIGEVLKYLLCNSILQQRRGDEFLNQMYFEAGRPLTRS